MDIMSYRPRFAKRDLSSSSHCAQLFSVVCEPPGIEMPGRGEAAGIRVLSFFGGDRAWEDVSVEIFGLQLDVALAGQLLFPILFEPRFPALAGGRVAPGESEARDL